jgi:hypothetical protein
MAYFNQGDAVLYGKYKNHKGVIKRIYLDERGHPRVEIEPTPLGRKHLKDIGLFTIWKADATISADPLAVKVAARFIRR